jgi:protein-tyrosine phosphatase
MILNFKAAVNGEDTVFGIHRPGYHDAKVSEDQIKKWVEYVKERGVRRVVCLLSESELNYFFSVPLLRIYEREFGNDKVLWVPIENLHLCTGEQLEKILKFLRESDDVGDRVVVHCNGGVGRTGFILAAWLVYGRGFGIEEALSAVAKTGRIPTEAAEYGEASRKDLFELLNFARRLREEEIL